MRKRENKRKSLKLNKKIMIITLLIIFVTLLFFSVIFSLVNVGNDKILNGVKIDNIDISDLTRDEVREKIQKYYEEIVLKDITLYYKELEETINVGDLEIKIDIEKIVEEALKIGKSGNILKDNYHILFTMLFKKEISLDLICNDEKLDKKIEDLNGKLPGAVVKTSYYIEGEELIIKKGTEGVTVEKEELKKLIDKTLKNTEKIIEIPVKENKIEEIDIEKIHKEIYKEAKDAYIERNPTKVNAHVNGVDFAVTIEEAKEILKEEKEEYVIPLKITIPSKTVDTLGEEAFPDKIAEFTTRYDASNKNRSINLALSSDKINGTIVLPGEKFSYNKIVGERTISKGYKEAAVYSNGKVVSGIGGGICQLSSTLYNAILFANLEITSRSNHMFLTSYVQAGRDATVSWGTIDFCFKNTRSYPIKIVSTVTNGIVRVQVYGLKEEKEYEVEIQTQVLETIDYKTNYIDDSTLDEGTEIIEQYGANGAKSQTYKIVKQNGNIISKTLLSTDTYSSLEKIVRRGTKKVVETNANIIETEEISTELEGFVETE